MTKGIYAQLPQIMVAPNGARRKKADHVATPVTIAQTVETAIACHRAGAGGIHAHLRDKDENHLLDAGLYRELQEEIRHHLPGFYIQVTTEAVGIYSPAEQRQVVYDCDPAAVSVSVTEMLRDGEDDPAVTRFYHDMAERDVAVQHILYSADDMIRLGNLVKNGVVPGGALTVLFVLGRYAKDLQSAPADLAPFVAGLPVLKNTTGTDTVDWACCAFGSGETDCLIAAMHHGGKCRIGFENNVFQPDGSIAKDNADRVENLRSTM